MVHVKDEGSHFEAPIETLWKFLQAETHDESHAKSTRNRHVKPLGENMVLITEEANMNGQWVKVANRITMFPPLGTVVEVLEGPMAGSKLANLYTPKGAKTQIDVYGEFTSAQIPAAQLEHAVRANLEAVFNDDTAALKEFVAKK